MALYRSPELLDRMAIKVQLLLHIQGSSAIWPRDLLFDPIWLLFKLDLDYIKTNELTNFIKIQYKMQPPLTTLVFVWFDLVSDPRWPIFPINLDFIKTSIQTNFSKIQLKMQPLLHTHFSYDLTRWYSFFFFFFTSDDPYANST